MWMAKKSEGVYFELNSTTAYHRVEAGDTIVILRHRDREENAGLGSDGVLILCRHGIKEIFNPSTSDDIDDVLMMPRRWIKLP